MTGLRPLVNLCSLEAIDSNYTAGTLDLQPHGLET